MAHPWYHTKETSAEPSSVFWAALHIFCPSFDRNRRGSMLEAALIALEGAASQSYYYRAAPLLGQKALPLLRTWADCGHLVTG